MPAAAEHDGAQQVSALQHITLYLICGISALYVACWLPYLLLAPSGGYLARNVTSLTSPAGWQLRRQQLLLIQLKTLQDFMMSLMCVTSHISAEMLACPRRAKQ